MDSFSGNEVLGNFVLECDGEINIGMLTDYVRGAIYYVSTIVSTGEFNGTVGFYNKDGYVRETVETVFMAQSSCPALLENLIASDFRIITIERSINIEESMELEAF